MRFYACAFLAVSLFLSGEFSEARQARRTAAFVPLAQGLEKEGWPEAAKGLVVLGHPGTQETFCSGAYVSDEGHILTASHCLDECFFHTQKKIVLTRNLFVILSYPRRFPGAQVCKLKVNGVETTVTAKLIAGCAASAVASSYVEKKHPQPHCQREKDFAVLVPEKTFPADFGCFALDTSGKQGVGAKVFTAGVPRKSERAAGNNSSGKELFFSTGELVRRDFCERGGEKILLNLSEISFPELKLQSTVDVLPGSSGGPMFHGRKLIGVASMKAPELDEKKECAGAAFFEPVTLLEAAIEKAKAAFSLSELRCERRLIR